MDQQPQLVRVLGRVNIDQIVETILFLLVLPPVLLELGECALVVWGRL